MRKEEIEEQSSKENKAGMEVSTCGNNHQRQCRQ